MSKSSKASSPKSTRRDISGIFLVDKPKGLSSNQVLQKVKYEFQAKKGGHTGALDPMATGLLPICLGEATKFSHYLLDSNKSYQATIQLGQKTDTGDAEGAVVETHAVPELTDTQINAVLTQFFGEQDQIPPMYSALKKDGKKLYELARQGIEIDRPARHINIFELTLSSYTKDSIDIFVSCSKGTYIRVLGEDIAKALGTLGHLTSLRRTHTGCFDLDSAMTVDALIGMETLAEKDLHLLPCYASITHLPTLQLDDSQRERVLMGQRLNVFEQVSTFFDESTSIEMQEVLMFCQQDFLGLGVLEVTGRLQPKKLVRL